MIADSSPRSGTRPSLVLSMLVRNEARRYLTRVLERHLPFVDHLLVIDDASEDGSAALIETLAARANKPLTLIRNERSQFGTEHRLRVQQWEETLKVACDWALVLDADEIFDASFDSDVGAMIAREDVDAFYFRLYDMWSETHYRDDTLWCAHRSYRPFLVRTKALSSFSWRETNQHCGRLPVEVTRLRYACHDARLQHLGWMKETDRLEKLARYRTLDPDNRDGSRAQYESITDPSPALSRWCDDERDEYHVSRFVRAVDPSLTHMLVPLPTTWWSRGHEYHWAATFVEREHAVLDAACGISHPFKLWLADHAKTVHACDLDRRIVDVDAIVADMRADFGETTVELLLADVRRRLEKVQRTIADLTRMPYSDGSLDTVFCVSVLEHLTADDRVRAITEMTRVLRVGGKLVLTFDVPTMRIEELTRLVSESGVPLRFLGPVDDVRYHDAISSSMWGETLWCFRAVLVRT